MKMRIDYIGSEGFKYVLLNSELSNKNIFENVFTETNFESQYSMESNIATLNDEIPSDKVEILENDFYKKIKKCLNSSESEILIVDLLSHKYELGINGYSKYTISDTFKTYIRNKEIILQSLESRITEFNEIFENLNKTLKKYKYIFFIKSFLPSVYIDDIGYLHQYNNINSINKVNSFLSTVYNVFESSIDNLKVIDIKHPIALGNKFKLSEIRYSNVTGEELIQKIKKEMELLNLKTFY